MIPFLRHVPRVNRDLDGAIPRDQLVKEFDREFEKVQNWTFEDWKRCLLNGTNKNSIRILQRSTWSNQIHEVNSKDIPEESN